MKSIDIPETFESSGEKCPIFNAKELLSELLSTAEEGDINNRATLERNLQVIRSHMADHLRLDDEVATLIGKCRKSLGKLKRS